MKSRLNRVACLLMWIKFQIPAPLLSKAIVSLNEPPRTKQASPVENREKVSLTICGERGRLVTQRDNEEHVALGYS